MRLPQLADVVPRLERAFAARETRHVLRPGARRAAVAVIVAGAADPSIVLIRRRVRSGDPWSGQMAFPGGFQASEEEPLEETARRETREETGLDLSAHGRLLGALDDFSPRTPHLPPLIVAPFVFAAEHRLSLSPSDEAAAALWIPLRQLFDSANRTSYTLLLAGSTSDFPAIQVGDDVVWGLTERILDQFAELLEQ